MALQPFPKRLAGIDPAVAVLAGHLHDEPERRFALWLRPHRMVDLEQTAPIDIALRPFADAVEIAGAKAEFSRAPAEEIDVFGCPQVEERTVDFRNPEDDDAAFRL